jgi:NTE family protein
MTVEWRPQSISFSSGGVRIIGHMGILARLLDSDILHGVQEWYGCSGGAICAFFGSLGVTSSWIRECIQHFDTRPLLNIREDLIVDFTTHWGVDSGEMLISYIGRFADTWEPGASQWTFADLARKRSAVLLGITATNVSRGVPVVFNKYTAPHMKILDAVRASSSVPLFFTPWINEVGEMFCDGAIVEYYPWSCIPNKKDTLVIACSEENMRGNCVSREEYGTKIRSVSEYISRILHLVRFFKEKERELPRNWITVNNKTVHLMDFHISKEQRLALFFEGEAAASAWLRFREKTAAQRKTEIPVLCADPGILGSGLLSEERTTDILLQEDLLLRSDPVPDLRPASVSRDRRWSV